jgi:hypothetical protein
VGLVYVLGGIMSGTRVCIRWYRVGLVYVLGGIERDSCMYLVVS